MARRKRLPPAIRRLIVDLKAEHPALNLSEISRICYARFGRRPDERTVGRVLEEEPVPLRMIRRYPPYREIPEARERRAAVVALHAEGWTVKAISSYLRINRDTAYAALKRWIEEGALAGREAALWLHAGSLTLEHGGRALSRYDVERDRQRSARLRRPAAALPNALRGGAAQALRARRGRVAKGAQAGRIR